MANLYDIAKRAGVSKTLVSRVINNQKGVSEKSRKAILAAVEELNYTPNELARSLVLKKTSIIGVILDSLCEPYFFDLIKGIEHEVTKSDYRVIFCSGRNRKELKDQYMDFFSSGRTDGVIIYGSNMCYSDNEALRNRIRANFPMVIVEDEADENSFNNIVIENAYGSKEAVNHLVEQGCKDILHITGCMTVKASIDRKRGYEEAMRAQGLEKYIDIIECREFGVEEGKSAVQKMLKDRDTLPDAIYFGADNTAFGGVEALINEGIKVPEDIMVVGFDDDEAKYYDLTQTIPALTTLHQPLYEAGIKAVDVLINQIKNPEEVKQKITIYPKLIIRESTKK